MLGQVIQRLVGSLAERDRVERVPAAGPGKMKGFATHLFINQQARLILRRDGWEREARLLDGFAAALDEGTVWADRWLKNNCHYYDPTCGAGLWLCDNAANKCQQFFFRALALWRGRQQHRAMRFLGAAVHLVQDLCVPHHATRQVFHGHAEYEKWVEQNYHSYAVEDKGTYHPARRPAVWVVSNATVSWAFYHLVCTFSPASYHAATSVLLPLAQRSTAGFLHSFCQYIWKEVF